MTRSAKCHENGNEENEENYIVNWKIMQKKTEKKENGLDKKLFTKNVIKFEKREPSPSKDQI